MDSEQREGIKEGMRARSEGRVRPWADVKKELAKDKQDSLEEQIRRYILVIRHMPSRDGQLEAMVISHFDIPDEQAKKLVAKVLDKEIVRRRNR